MILVICELVITGLGLELRAAEFTWSPVGGVRTPAGDVWAWLRLEPQRCVTACDLYRVRLKQPHFFIYPY